MKRIILVLLAIVMLVTMTVSVSAQQDEMAGLKKAFVQ